MRVRAHTRHDHATTCARRVCAWNPWRAQMRPNTCIPQQQTTVPDCVQVWCCHRFHACFWHENGNFTHTKASRPCECKCTDALLSAVCTQAWPYADADAWCEQCAGSDVTSLSITTKGAFADNLFKPCDGSCAQGLSCKNLAGDSPTKSPTASRLGPVPPAGHKPPTLQFRYARDSGSLLSYSSCLLTLTYPSFGHTPINNNPRVPLIERE